MRSAAVLVPSYAHHIVFPSTWYNVFTSIWLPCSSTNKGKRNLCGCADKANRQWAFVAFWLSSYVNIKTAAAFANWLALKKGALFSLIYFFGSFCIYYIPHNYVIPQTMPHAIPQTHSPFYPHRFSFLWSKPRVTNLAISSGHSAYITFHIIMSFPKPCYMPFRKLILPFTLTASLFFEVSRG